ncbi:PotD/PotF family extracellular solute-binding protein [Devosia sp.]|uniref:ABC transporter substrate-binding protein n=1 Tax=Devosia sp. TaxID=1871048 RepID=UPI00273777FC|nr:extracellular solute-binding protein [Devosia sp.]MDP2780348.1 extracellular solute-binding protein [Devosia sp.]
MNDHSMVPAPAVIRSHDKTVLRVLCTEIIPVQQLRARAKQDLGYEVVFEQHDFVTAQRIAATEPDRYDIYDQCFHNLDIVWHWRAIQPIDLARIEAWDDVSDLTKKGGVNAEARIGLGDAPVTRLYVQPDHSLSSSPSGSISMLPTVHNFDCFAVNQDATGADVDRDMTSWAELLNPRWNGGVGIVDEPAIGIFDLALAFRATGQMRFNDIGNMSVTEIDQLIELAIDLRASGHFTAFWRTSDEASDHVRAHEMLIGSMWSPSVIALKASGIRMRQAVPVEGYRAWHGGLCLARHLSGHRLDQAYGYLNWYLSGWPGAIMARQGYYMSVPARVRDHLQPEEWDYWYGGKEASMPLPDVNGAMAIRPGDIRSGGAYWSRAAHIALWNTTMDEHNYLVRRWGELVSGSDQRNSRGRRQLK